MTKVSWLSKQFSRFDLALTKMSRPFVAVNTIANLSVALVVGYFLFGVLFILGFSGLVVTGYALHKSGFFMQTTIETFDQQSKTLYERQIRFMAATIANYARLEDEALDKIIEEVKGDLRL